MVEQNRSGTYTEIVYGPHGRKLALMNGQTLQKAFVPLAGGAVAVYNSSGLAYYRHSDWLGSSRFTSTPTRTMYSDEAYAPFGEPYAQSGTADLSFTGQNQDTVSGLYDFPAREYATQGRWPSPDPAGRASVYPTDPQTWNRYAYVRNTPLHLFDLTGMVIPPPIMSADPNPGGGGGGACVWDNGSYDASDDSETGSMTQCNALGGTWDFGLAGADFNPNPDRGLADLVSNSNNQYIDSRCPGSTTSQLTAAFLSGIPPIGIAATVAAATGHVVTVGADVSGTLGFGTLALGGHAGGAIAVDPDGNMALIGTIGGGGGFTAVGGSVDAGAQVGYMPGTTSVHQLHSGSTVNYAVGGGAGPGGSVSTDLEGNITVTAGAGGGVSTSSTVDLSGVKILACQ